MVTNINIPYQVKSTGYFQLSGYKKIRQHVILSQESRYIIVEKVLLITTKLALSREFILMQSSPPSVSLFLQKTVSPVSY